MDNALIFAVVAYAVGVVARIVIPYLQERLDTGQPFDWRFVVGQLLASVVALVPVVTGAEWLAQVGAAGWLAAFGLGWAAGDIGRQVQKATGR